MPYKPYLFVDSDNPTGYTTLAKKNVKRVDFNDIYEAKDFVKKYSDIMPIYGMQNYAYTYINDTFPEELEFSFDQVRVGIFDIEVGSENGFPDPQEAKNEVTAITIVVNGVYHVFACEEYTPHMPTVEYHKCRNERDLLRKFILAWNVWDLDIVTGWYSERFDIPYLVNRIRRVFGQEHVNKLSPWGIVYPKKLKDEFTGEAAEEGEEFFSYNIVGIAHVDYRELYKKHAYIPQENYKLDTVAFNDLGISKIDHSEYSSLHRFYKENPQKFIEYNVRDCELIKKLDELHGLMNVVILLALDSKALFSDALGSIRLWDVMIHNDLMAQKIVVDPVGQERKLEKFKGAFVKPPQVARHRCVVAVDVRALYPSLIVQQNISPETYRGRFNLADITIQSCLESIPLKQSIQEHLKANNQTLTSNGCLWDKDIEGLFPRLVKKSLSDRALYKSKMIDSKKLYEETKEEKYKIDAQRYKVIQHVRKIQINSLYGCLGNDFFRWFRIDAAEGITFTGQFTIRWAHQRINQELNKLAGTQGVDFIIAMDTDSAYLTLERFVPANLLTEERVDFLIKFTEDVLPEILDKIFQEACDMLNGCGLWVEMKREAIADNGFWTAKKRYALNVWWDEGVRYKEPKLKIVGLESVKSSTPTACRKYIEQAIRYILQGTEEDLQKYVPKIKEEYKKLPFSEIGFPKGVNGVYKYYDHEKIYGYKTPIHTKASLFYNHLLHKLNLTSLYETIKDGEKIKWTYLELPNPMNVEVIASGTNSIPDEFKLKGYLDYDKMFAKSFIEPVSKMTKAVGWRLITGDTIEEAFNAEI